MKKGQIIQLAILFLGIFVIVGSVKLKVGSPFAPGPGFLPFYSSLLLIFFSVLVFKDEARRVYLLHWEKPLLVFLALFLYAVFLELLGYLISTAILMFVLFWSCGLEIRWSVFYASAVCFCSYLLFKILLKVPLPESRFLGS